jgi:O-methyltransferase
VPEPHVRTDALDPLPYDQAWPSLRSAWGRIDVHTLAAFWVCESKLSGHYLEFGVGAGRSAVAALRAHRRYNPERVPSFFLFDSFEGLPALSGRDAGSTQFHAGQFAFGLDEVRGTLTAHGVWDASRVHLVPGFFEHSLATFDRARLGGLGAAVVHVDVDLHASARVVLDWVTPLLQQGTLLMFDDWNTFAASWDHGERAAAREWLEANPGFNLESYAKYGWHGEAFLVQRGA